jgi:RNA polymerase sigma-70 factor (ECF subfamily)
VSEAVPVRDCDADRRAVEKLSRQHRPALLRYFQRKGFQPPDDQDAAQEVLVRLLRREGIATAIEHFEGYLFATAAHVATDLHRQRRAQARDRHEVYDEARHAPPDHGPEEILQGREALMIVTTALKELSERTRTIFILARLEHMRHVEIAQRLGVAINTVEKHLQKATSHLGERVGRGR